MNNELDGTLKYLKPAFFPFHQTGTTPLVAQRSATVRKLMKKMSLFLIYFIASVNSFLISSWSRSRV